MREFVFDEPVQLIRGIVDRQHHPVVLGLGKAAHRFVCAARVDVFLLEFAVRLEEDHRHAERQVVPEIGIMHFTDGKWKDAWYFADELGLMLQLDALQMLQA